MNERFSNIALFMFGLLLFYKSMFGPVVTPERFGNAVYIIPAEVWSISIMFAASAVLLGGLSRGWKSPILRIFGNSVMLSVFGAFAYLSNQAMVGDFMISVSVVYFVTQCVVFIYSAAKDLWRIEWV